MQQCCNDIRHSRAQDAGLSPVTVSVALAVLLLGLLAPAARGKRLQVLTTVAPLTNIVKNVGGPHIDLHGLIPGGTDSHTFEPAPSDIRFIAEADVIILNGLSLEVPTEKLALANKKPATRILTLGDRTIAPQEYVFDRSFPKSAGHPNPHLWMNPLYAARYAELVRESLAELDPTHAAAYHERTQLFTLRLHELDRAIAAAIQTVPPPHRKLLTYHDSFAYFAPRYGLAVIGAIEPASFSEPSPREVARVIRQLKQEKLPAVFGSEVFPSKVLDQIAREAGVQFIATLRDDDLPGPPGLPEHSYIGMMLENVRTMVSALGGRTDALHGIDPRDMP
ncbi:MAG TPA: metal ABC transporter substrate-binding protein [Candidatus Tectomicrobia bacterium]|nr:metal ABC transporter substrate-binding protein [Candidatus Tectomicrobia bacterium]